MTFERMPLSYKHCNETTNNGVHNDSFDTKKILNWEETPSW